jgi:hypothetical protein
MSFCNNEFFLDNLRAPWLGYWPIPRPLLTQGNTNRQKPNVHIFEVITRRRPCRHGHRLFDFLQVTALMGRSLWQRRLRHELSSPAQTLGSWVRILLEAWMSVCVYSVFVQVAVLRWADPPSKESYRLCEKIKELKERPRSNKWL